MTGAELVLSVNAANRQHAPDWGCEVVAVPDTPSDLDSLNETLAVLDAAGVKARIDPVLEPIGFGFAASLGRYLEARRRWPGREMMMGIGNLTELTDADSAGINVLLLGFCQELGIRSVLTTQVISSAVESLQGSLARVVIFADQQSTRTDTNQTSYAGAQFAVTARRINGQWKISEIDTYTTQAAANAHC